MLNDYVGKNVRILVASCSGAGTISADERYSNGVMTSVMNFYGVVKRVDDKFIELEDTRYNLYNLDLERAIGLSRPVEIDMSVFESDKVIINLNNVIVISLI